MQPHSASTHRMTAASLSSTAALQRKPVASRQCLRPVHTVMCQAKSTAQEQKAAEEQQAIQDVVAAARLKVSTPAATQRPKPNDPMSTFVFKVQAAWRIFFPPKQADMTPKDEGKKRLRMILVADRCGMNQSSLYEMKHSIVQVVSEFVEVEGDELVDVNVSADGEQGTIYTVSVPVRRVKPQARLSLGEGDPEAAENGVTMEWENDDPDADPSARFPFGC
ncbi:TPA: Cell division topological specificity factor, chloroplastic [Trebouxia sp. C0005]|nr:MAG: plastid division regulator [Trebouxia sp. A1-2]